MIYNLKDESFEYHVRYSNRKSIELKIEPSGLLKLSVPEKTSDKVIEDILKKKAEWVIEKIELMKNSYTLRQYISGESIQFLGQNLKTTIIRRNINRNQLSKVADEIIVVVSQEATNEHIKALFIGFYKQQLKVTVNNRIAEYQKHFEKKPIKVTIRDQKTRWGNCSSKGSLNFNYRLLMAPLSVIDYIVVHELCHMEIMDHSKHYWHRVEEVMPDYKVYDKWLKVNGRKLNFDYLE